MLIFDGHLDLAWSAMQGNRDLMLPLAEIRARLAAGGALPAGDPEAARRAATVCFPEMRRGRVGLCMATVFARSSGRPVPLCDYPTVAQANGVAWGQLAWYRALDRLGHVRVIADRKALDRHAAEWESWDASGGEEGAAPPPGVVVNLEGADPVLAPDGLGAWRDAGLRVVGLAHVGAGRYAGGTGAEEGLADAAGPLLAEMRRLGLILDLSHSSERTFREALERFDGPVMASHSNCRALVDRPRQLSDGQIRALIARGGVVGAVLDESMLDPRPRGERENATVAAAAGHIDHVCQLAGDCRHAAVGSDLDGGCPPRDLESIADLQRLGGILAARGYGAADLAAILWGNWLSFLRNAWG
ncbi:MAG: membrane dipeptidase [Planctomycetota bacterium]